MHVQLFIADYVHKMPEDTAFLRMPYGDCAKLLISEAFCAADVVIERLGTAAAWLSHDDNDRAFEMY